MSKNMQNAAIILGKIEFYQDHILEIAGCRLNPITFCAFFAEKLHRYFCQTDK